MKTLAGTRESVERHPRAALNVRVAARRAHGMIAYLAILSTALAAFAGAPLWAVMPGTLVLLTISLVEQRKLSSRFAAIGQSHMMTAAALESSANALMATGAAYGLGLLVRVILVASN